MVVPLKYGGMEIEVKKLLAIILSITVILTCFGAVVASAVSNELTISASDAEGARGETVTITLTVESNPGFAALLINVSGGDNFEVVSYENGSVMSQITTGRNVVWDSASDVSVTGNLLTITIRIGENAPLGDNTINVRAIECFNESGETVVVSAENIKITVKDGETTVGSTSTEANDTNGENDEDAISTETVKNDTTKVEEENDASNDSSTEKNGCGSVVFGNVALISLVSLTGFAIKRKKD